MENKQHNDFCGECEHLARIDYKTRCLKYGLYVPNTLEKSDKCKKDSNSQELWDADPNCDHDIEVLWIGVKCKKCGGWFCL